MTTNCDLNDSEYMEKVLKNYGDLRGDLHLVELDRGEANGGCGGGGGGACLGLSLAGNRDLATMSVFVVGIQPATVAAVSGLVHVGDELLEINGQVLYGRSHLNASAIIKAISSLHIKILLVRSDDYTERLAVSPLRLPPVTYKNSRITLIPKKPKSLSLDDVPIHDDSNRVLDSLQRIPESSDPPATNDPVCPAHVLTETVTTETDASFNKQQKIIETTSPAKENIPAHFTASSPTLEKPLVQAKNCLPLGTSASSAVTCQSKGRRLQKSAQVEEMEEEGLGGKAGGGGGGGIGIIGEGGGAGKTQRNGERCCSTQLKHQDAKSIDMEIVASPEVGGGGNWNGRADEEEVSLAETSTNSSSPLLHPSGSASLDDPVSCAIVSGKTSTIEIRKGKLGLGIKVIGGSDTVLKAIIIYEIYKNGAAAKDGRLWPGDQILEVNGKDLRDVSHSRAVDILRQVATTVRLVVFRDEAIYRDDDLHDVMTVELMKKPGKGLGMSIISRRDDHGILISDIVKGGVADADGRLCPGDQILAVNGDDMRTATQDYAAQLLKTSMGKIVLTIGRLKTMSKLNLTRNSSSIHNSRGIMKSESNASDCKNASRRTAKNNPIGCHAVLPCIEAQSD